MQDFKFGITSCFARKYIEPRKQLSFIGGN